MWHRSRREKVLCVAAALVVIAACGDDDDEEPVPVALSDITVAVDAATVRALEDVEFTFDNGSAIAVEPGSTGSFPAEQIVLAFSNTTAADPSFSLESPSGSATGKAAFGSCTFTTESSTYSPGEGPQVGDLITVNPCQFNVATGGIQATGQATAVQILLQLGLIPSQAQQAQVSIDPTTGTVTVNDVNTGDTVTLTITGSHGGSTSITF